MPPQMIEKELCGLGLLAHVVLSKYIEHRPLDRVQQELARNGVKITRTTLADWVDVAHRNRVKKGTFLKSVDPALSLVRSI
jgi:transposase